MVKEVKNLTDKTFFWNADSDVKKGPFRLAVDPGKIIDATICPEAAKCLEQFNIAGAWESDSKK